MRHIYSHRGTQRVQITGARWLLNRIVKGNGGIMKSWCQSLGSKQAKWASDKTQTHAHVCVAYTCIWVFLFLFLISQWKPMMNSEHCDTGQFLTAWSRGWNEREYKENCFASVVRVSLISPTYTPPLYRVKHIEWQFPLFLQTLAFSLSLENKGSDSEETHSGKREEGMKSDPVRSVLYYKQKLKSIYLVVEIIC